MKYLNKEFMSEQIKQRLMKNKDSTMKKIFSLKAIIINKNYI